MTTLAEATPLGQSEFVPAMRAPPAARAGAMRWLRTNLFSSKANAALTVLTLSAMAVCLVPLARWGIGAATLSGTTRAACEPDGACWTFIRLRLPVLLLGHYPTDQAWRVLAAGAMLLAGCGPAILGWSRWGWAGLAGLLCALALLVGGVGPLPYVEPEDWGGLLLNVIVTVLVALIAMPLGIALAVGRRSALPVVRTLSVGFIEFWRGVPLLGVLFVSAVMLPLFLPQGMSLSRLLRAVLAMGLFNAAYVAEVVRGGLQGVQAGQEEAATSLGLHPWRVTRLVVLPQALRLSIPGLVNTVIDLFKDTTLISIIGLYELLGTTSQALRDPAWLGLAREGFAFAAAVFFVCCFSISLYSRSLERRLLRGAA